MTIHIHWIMNCFLVTYKNFLIKKRLINQCIDFVNHTRSKKIEHIDPKPIIIVEGILILENQKIRDIADMMLFVEADEDTRFIRRMLRDMNERGRSLDSIINQYTATV